MGFTGARWYVRCHEPAIIVEAMAEVHAVVRDGTDVRNPAGLVRYLVTQAEAMERSEAETSQDDRNELREPYPLGEAAGRGGSVTGHGDGQQARGGAA